MFVFCSSQHNNAINFSFLIFFNLYSGILSLKWQDIINYNLIEQASQVKYVLDSILLFTLIQFLRIKKTHGHFY